MVGSGSAFVRVAACGWLVVALAGCRGDGDGKTAAPKHAVAVSKSAALPNLGAYLPPLDDNRLQVAPPLGWQVPPRDSRWIAHFQEKPGSKYPAILITAEDYRRISNVSKDNVVQFARQVAAERDLSKVEPVQIGRFVGATYRTRAKQKTGIGMIVDRLFLETVVDKRKYVLELRTRDDTVAEYQPFLYAVAAGMKFGKVEPVQAVENSSEPQSHESSEAAAEKEPAEPPKTAPKQEPAGDAKQRPAQAPQTESQQQSS